MPRIASSSIIAVLATGLTASASAAMPRADAPRALAAVTGRSSHTVVIDGFNGFAAVPSTNAVKAPTGVVHRFGEEAEGEGDDAGRPVRQVPGPPGPPVPPTPDVSAASAARTLAAADDYAKFRDTVVAPAVGSAIATGEPTVANARGTLLYTGNFYAGVSADNGLSWRALNPSSRVYPTYDAGFCCDQVAYAVDRGGRTLVFWLRQFANDGQTGKLADKANGHLSLIVFQGGAELRSEDELFTQQDWCEYRFKPSDFGQATHGWFDFNQMSNTKDFLYLSSKAERNLGDTDGDGKFDSNFLSGDVWRISLDELDTDTCDPVTVRYWTGYGENPALVQGAGDQDAMHWATAGPSTDEIDVTRVADDETIAKTFPETITSYLDTERPTKTSTAKAAVCTQPDGTDPCQRVNDRVNSGYRTPNEVGWFWMVRQGTGRPFPHIRGVRFTAGTTPTLIDEPDIWNAQQAWIYPTVGANAAGHAAVLAYQAGGVFFTNPAAALVDDVAPDTDWTSLSFHSFEKSTAGAGTWGDYESVRAYNDCPNSYAGAVQRLNGRTVEQRFVWFGRERDGCPDLATTSVSPGRTSVKPGQLVRVNHSIRNTGSGDAPGSTSRFFWSEDATQSADDEKSRDSVTTANVAPEVTRKMPAVAIPAPRDAGSYYLIACADGDDAIAEISDNDNCLASTDRVVVERTPTAHPVDVSTDLLHATAGTRLPLAVQLQQPGHAARRTVTVFLADRSSARARRTRIGMLTVPANASSSERRLRARGRLRLPRRAHVRRPFLLACLGAPRPGSCAVARRPLIVVSRRH